MTGEASAPAERAEHHDRGAIVVITPATTWIDVTWAVQQASARGR